MPGPTSFAPLAVPPTPRLLYFYSWDLPRIDATLFEALLRFHLPAMFLDSYVDDKNVISLVNASGSSAHGRFVNISQVLRSVLCPIKGSGNRNFAKQ